MRIFYFLLLSVLFTACTQEKTVIELPVMPGEQIEFDLGTGNYVFAAVPSPISNNFFQRPAVPEPGTVEENILYLERFSSNSKQFLWFVAQRVPTTDAKNGLPLPTGVEIPVWIALRARTVAGGEGGEHVLSWHYDATMVIDEITPAGQLVGTFRGDLETTGNKAPLSSPEAHDPELGFPGDNSVISGSFKVSVSEIFR